MKMKEENESNNNKVLEFHVNDSYDFELSISPFYVPPFTKNHTLKFQEKISDRCDYLRKYRIFTWKMFA